MCTFHFSIRVVTIFSILTGITLWILSYMMFSWVTDINNSMEKIDNSFAYTNDTNDTGSSHMFKSTFELNNDVTMNITWKMFEKKWKQFQPFMWTLSGVTVTAATLIILTSAVFLCCSDSGVTRNVKKWIGAQIVLTLVILCIIIVTVTLALNDMHQETNKLLVRVNELSKDLDPKIQSFMKDTLEQEEIRFVSLCIALGSTTCVTLILILIAFISMLKCKGYHDECNSSSHELLAIDKYY